MSIRALSSAFAAVMLIAAAVPATPAQPRVPLSDAQIQAQIEHRLANEDIRGVTVTVQDRTVTLSGTVASLWAKAEAIDEATEVKDIKNVIDELAVMRGESDQAVGEAVATRLRRYVFFTIYDDVNVEMEDGVATLTGAVTMPHKAEAMVKLASRVAGVQQVIDKIETLPVSISDDQIRYVAAVRIYNDPMFWNYAIQPDPPIHIVVKHGRVTLTGVVLSQMERIKAEHIVRSIFGVFSVENALRVERETERR